MKGDMFRSPVLTNMDMFDEALGWTLRYELTRSAAGVAT